MSPKRTEDLIARNRRDIARQFASARLPAGQTTPGILLSPVPVSVSVDIEVYTRPLNDSLIVGHPDASQGIGRGALGDQRGAWTSQESVTTSLTRDGRQAVADALTGESVALAEITVGDGTANTWEISNATPGQIDLRALFAFDESPDTVSTPTLEVSDGRTLTDASTSVDVDDNTEARVDVTVTIEDGSRTGSEAVTNPQTVADAIRPSGGSPRLDTVALGTDDTKPSTSDTALGSQEIERQAALNRTGQSATATTVVYSGEPSGASFPLTITEIGVFDSNDSLVLRAVFDGKDKREDQRLRGRSGIQID